MSDRTITPWELCYRGWDPGEQPLREALTTLGNGRFATRGAAEEASAKGPHYPGTYLPGGYDRLESEVAGRIIENEDLVNWPNWLPLGFRVDGESEWFDIDGVEILEYEHALDLRAGIMARTLHFRDRAAREFVLESRRLVNMDASHIGAIEWVLTPVSWSGRIEIYTGIDGRVSNSGVSRYRGLEGDHLEILDCGPSGEDAVFLVARTRQSHLVVAQSARTRVFIDGEPAVVERRTEAGGHRAGQYLVVACSARKPVRVEKIVTLHATGDFAISEPRLESCKQVHRLPDFDAVHERHQRAWRHLWQRADLEILSGEDCYPQTILRLHIFHLLQTASMHTIDRDVGVPARGLHGEAYRGHVFWDELFIFPFLNLRLPELTRSLLMYRYRRLDEARFAARKAGHAGAMFPWQSGSDGREESQVFHLNPESGRWIPDETHRQRHVSSAIAYNVWQYYQATGDMEFLSFHGAEMLLEIASFWASIASYNADRRRYEICGVVGPDEFHTRYPGRDSSGIDNNAYTNVMAAWVLETARTALDLLAEDVRCELLERLGISDQDLHHWREVRGCMYVPFHGDGIISQFEGWDDLEELDWQELERRHGDIHRLDRILEAEGDDINRYKASKQADVLMLFFLFSTEQLVPLFAGMGYELLGEQIPRNVSYYLARTSHGSTLSRVVHAWVMSRSDRERSWHLFCNALASDIDDAQGGTTPEGIHMGAMAGTVDLAQRCYTGIEMRDGILWLNPLLPDELERLAFAVRYHGNRLALEVNHRMLEISVERGGPTPARIGFGGEVYDMAQGQKRTFTLGPRRGEEERKP